MADHQPLNATFFAFRRRERGGVLLGASIAYLVLALLFAGAFFLVNAQGIMDYVNWATSMGASVEGAATGKPGAEAAAVNAMMPPASVMAMVGWEFLFMIFYYILLAAYEAACLRWMIHGETGGIMGLSLSADTWRVYFTYWLWLILLFTIYIVFFLVAGGAAVSLMAVSQGGGDLGSVGIVSLVVGLALILGIIYFGVRFAPAAATSVARRKFSFFDAWSVSKGRFWALFGAYFLIILMFCVFYIIFAMAAGFAMAGMMMTLNSAPPQTPEEAFRAFANPQVLITISLFAVVMIAASLTLYVAFFGVNARAASLALEEGKIKPAE